MGWVMCMAPVSAMIGGLLAYNVLEQTPDDADLKGWQIILLASRPPNV